MDWDGLADAKTLFPSFTGDEDGYLPALPDDGPVWPVSYTHLRAHETR